MQEDKHFVTAFSKFQTDKIVYENVIIGSKFQLKKITVHATLYSKTFYHDADTSRKTV